jgi:DUF4097 and DUF4098 domain-containing protein YvlB
VKKLLYCLALTAVFTMALSARAETEKVEKTFSAGKGGTLVIDSDVGSIEVGTWDKGEVYVSVKKQASSQKRLDGFEVQIEQKGNDIYIDGKNKGHNRVHVEFYVSVPREYNVDLKTGGGSIDVADINGNVKINTSGGSISIGNVESGDINAHTSGGSIKVGDVIGKVKVDTSGGSIAIGNVAGGDVDAHTSGGSIKVNNVDGNLKVDTSGGSINLDKITGTSLIHTSGGSISLSQGGENVKANTSGGSINIGPTKGKVEVHTSGGNINIGMTDGDVDADTSGGSINVEGSRGEIIIHTSGGNLFVGSSEGPVKADTSGGNIKILQTRGAIDAETSGGSIEARMTETDNSKDTHVSLHSSGGEITVYLPGTIEATVTAKLKISRFADRDYQIYSDFPLKIKGEESNRINAEGDLNGGGDRIDLKTTNGDIYIKKL